MPSCCAFGCTNRSSRKPSKQKNAERKAPITFHKFPKNPERRSAWLKAIGRGGWEPTSASILCSEHFMEESIDRTSLSCVRLREFAVPSIFSCAPSNLPKKIEVLNPTVNGITLIAPLILSSDDFKTVPQKKSAIRRTSRKPFPLIRQIRDLKIKYRKKISLLQQTNRRNFRRITTLSNVLKSLKDRNLLQEEQIQILNRFGS